MNTTISITKETRGLIQEIGKKSESYDDVIKRLIFERTLRQKAEEFINADSYVSIEDAIEWTKLKIKNDKN
jgi:predicted CopG family antitoxin